MDQRGTSLSLYSVICPRCETVSPMDQPACPYCGADRHGAVLTKGAETAVRAVEAARAVLHHAYERGELTRIEPLRTFTGDARLPAPVRPLGLTTMLPPRPTPVRTPHPVLMMLMAGVIAALALGVFSRIRSDLDRAAPRSRLDAVSAAGEVRKPEPVTVAAVAPKAPEPAAQDRSFAMALPTSTSLFHNAAPIAFAPHTPDTSANLVTPQASKPAPEVHKPAVARRGVSTAHARIKQKEKADTRIAAQSSSNRQKARDTACASKNAKRCADLSPRRASKEKEKEKEPAKRQQARTTRRDAPAARAPSDANAFQQVNALPAPIKPAMTSDDSWKPGKRAN